MKIEIEAEDLMLLIAWARRYCDGRCTDVPQQFNEIYERLNHGLGFQDKLDNTLALQGRFWPYAQGGFYDPESGSHDITKLLPKKSCC